MQQVGAETLVEIRKKCKDKTLHYACDAAIKGGHHHMVKKMSWHSYEERELNIITLDSDACDGTDIDAANALDYSFRKLDPIEGTKRKFNGQGTDSGGGSTSDGLQRQMELLQHVSKHSITTKCSIHGHNMCVKSLTDKFIGAGAVSYRNYMQLVFAAYAVQKEFEPM